MTWPRLAEGLVAAHGVHEVWRVGLAVLGYPPTWITHTFECNTIWDAFQHAKKERELCNG